LEGVPETWMKCLAFYENMGFKTFLISISSKKRGRRENDKK